MESVGAFPCSELDSFMVSDFLGESLFPGGHDEGFSPSLEAKTGVAAVSESLVCSVNNPESSLDPVSQQCSYYSCDPTDGVSFHNVPARYLSGFNQIPENNHVFVPADMFMGIAGVHQENTADPYVAAVCSVVGAEGTGCVNNEGMRDHRATNFITADALALAKEMLLKRKCDAPEKNIVDSSENAGSKRIRVSRDVGSDGQSSCSYSSEDDNAGPETKPCMAMNSNGKTRAARGGATDPQSLYARKRRERINERLRILQNLVPNGTKVDISTMLEEAVHYVKFLQLQIKLLSSDDLWMYAPLAYNGIDMGLHQKIFSQLLRQ